MSVQTEMLHASIKQYRREFGHCWKALVPTGFPPGDGSDDNDRSRLRLLEDGRELGPAHAQHTLIRERGEGGYSHWGNMLYFSTSDNSDPGGNGRSYTIVAPADWAAMGRDPAGIPGEVAYAVSLAENYLRRFGEMGVDPKGCSILEIGPGRNFGLAILMACEGAKVTVADRFLSPWVAGYHPLFLTELARAWRRPTPAIDAMIAAEGFEAGLTLIDQPAEALSTLADASQDLVLSVSVMEHLFDVPAALRELRRVAKAGGRQCHGIDLRDHACLARPFEHLLEAPEAFDRSNRAVNNERGTQLREGDFTRLMVEAGFAVERIERHVCDDAAYMADFLARLRISDSPWAGRSDGELSVDSAGFSLVVS